jgi:glycosyltransferase involved in cell wall biosynthesis
MENSKAKICHIANVDRAVKFLLLNQLKFLQQQGYNVSAVCSNGKFVKDIENQGIKVKTIEIKRKISPISDLISLFQLFFYLRKEKFDIVHTHTPKPGLLGQLAAKMAGTPIIVNTIHGFYFNKDSNFLKRKFYIFIEKIAGKCSDLIFSQNQEDIQTAIKENICSEQKIKHLGNGVDLEKFNIDRFPREFIINKRQELGISEHRKIIGIVGRLVQEKGYYDLFQAVSKIIKEFPEILVLAIGPTEPGKKDFVDQNIVEKLGIKDNVLFLGERTDIDEIYPLMDIFVLPSRREGFPRSVLEASALARPIIATNIRGCREAVDNGNTGVLIPERNPGKLAEAITYFLKNPDEAKQMSANARKKAENEFDENAVFAKINQGYQNLIKQKIQ